MRTKTSHLGVAFSTAIHHDCQTELLCYASEQTIRSFKKEKVMLEAIRVIQGGMGVGVSDYRLSKAVSTYGDTQVALGTVSGVAAPHVLMNTLRKGDKDGRMRHALAHFPYPETARRVIDTHLEFDDSPKKHNETQWMFSLKPSRELVELTIAANFALVWLAKEGHDRAISINYLEKAPLPHLPSIYGAMLAGVDVVTVGAGIPLQIPAILDAYARGHPARYRAPVEGAVGEEGLMEFDPVSFFFEPIPVLKRPAFLPIVSTDSLASILAKKLAGKVDGFIVERPTAGGHNAGPRGHEKRFNERGEPVYGESDVPNWAKMRGLKIPFWIGGSFASPLAYSFARARGAQGIQVGSIFALADESGMDPSLARKTRLLGYRGDLDVLTSNYSPTGFPFKVARIHGTLSDSPVYANRRRVCDKGYLVTLHRATDGNVIARCAAEPEHAFVRKGGKEDDALSKVCLCNGLLATVGLGSPKEPPIVTLGNDVDFLQKLMAHEGSTYTTGDALRYLLGS